MMVAVVEEVTAVVVTAKVAAKLPAVTLTLAGTAAAELLLDNPINVPPAGAGPLKVTVPVDGLPPVTVVGFSDTDASATPCPAFRDKVTVDFAAIETLSCNWPP